MSTFPLTWSLFREDSSFFFLGGGASQWIHPRCISGCLGGGGRFSVGGFVKGVVTNIPSRELTYPTLGKGKSSSKVNFDGIC